MYINIRNFHISPVFLSVVAFFLIVDTSFYTLLLLACAAAHELGHYVIGRVLGAEVEGVYFRPFGINIVLKESTQIGYGDEVLIALAGPLINILISILVVLWSRTFGLFDAAGFLLLVNLGLAAVNLLPIDCLDGGRAVKNLLLCFCEYDTAQKVSLVISVLTLIPLTWAAVLLVGYSGHNLSLALIAVFLILRVSVQTLRGVSVSWNRL